MKWQGWLTVLLILPFVFLQACGWQTASGTKVGTVIKLSQQGAFHSTWEGELIRGGMANGSGAFSITPLHFTVDNPSMLPAVQDALDKQYEVEVTYVKYAWAPWSSDNTGFFLRSIKRR